jgi:hypothetical protein
MSHLYLIQTVLQNNGNKIYIPSLDERATTPQVVNKCSSRQGLWTNHIGPVVGDVRDISIPRDYFRQLSARCLCSGAARGFYTGTCVEKARSKGSYSDLPWVKSRRMICFISAFRTISEKLFPNMLLTQPCFLNQLQRTLSFLRS